MLFNRCVRSSHSAIQLQMADSVANDCEESKRVIRSRSNTSEERLNQKKEWKKKKRRERKRTRNAVHVTTARQEGNDAETNDPAIDETNDPANDNDKKRVKERNDKKKTSPLKPPSHFQRSSRGALMLQMARGGNVDLVNRNQPKPPLQTSSLHRDSRTVVKERVITETYLKELNPDHLEYLSEHAVGSGSYGECYRAQYRGIEAIAKKMTHNDTAEGKDRAKRNLFHEARVVSSLGDHASLPLFLGILSQQLCMVTQFHGVNDASVTLHRAADTNMLTPPDSTEIFLEICSALKHVHSRGFLHNDIKANNVVLETKLNAPEKYTPVLIDFGKSTKARASSSVALGSRKRIAPEHTKSYLAPEVTKDRLYSVASDLYSFAKMFKAVSTMVGFYPKVRALVKEATAETPSLRPCLDDFKKRLAAVKF